MSICTICKVVNNHLNLLLTLACFLFASAARCDFLEIPRREVLAWRYALEALNGIELYDV